MFNLAYAASRDGPTPEALEAYPQAQAVWEGLLRDRGENIAWRYDLGRCYFNHAKLLASSGPPAPAIDAMKKSVEHFDRLVELAPGNPGVADMHQRAHDHYSAWLEATRPESIAARAIANAEDQAAKTRRAGDWKSLKQLGTKLLDSASRFRRDKRPREMEQVYQTAIRLVAEAAKSDPSPDSAHLEAAICFDLNADLRALGCMDGAEEAAHNARRRWARLHAQYPADWRFQNWLAGAHNNLGLIRLDTGRLAAAEAEFRRVLAMREAAAADIAENQLYRGGTYCNLGNVYLELGQLDTARGYYEQGRGIIESVRDKLKGNNLVGQFLKNCQDGLEQCSTRAPLEPDRFVTATAACIQVGPPPLSFEGIGPELLPRLQAADALRRAADPAAVAATAELVKAATDCPDVWFLRGLVLGFFAGDARGDVIQWEDSRHEEAVASFYEALVLRPDYYDAMLYKGLALTLAAHAAQAGVRALTSAVEKMPEAEQNARLAPKRKRFRCDVARARESFEAAARMRPAEGRPWYELILLYRELGYEKEAEPYLEKLKAIDPQLWEKAG